jgi:Transglutaminase-like superfamily
MRSRLKHPLTACLAILLLAIALFWPAFPWSYRLRYTAKRAGAKFESRIAAWRGQQPRPISISGKLIGSGAFIESLKGAQVIALESTSGYAAMSDSQGRFTLPHLVWYPGATYTLFITADTYHTKYLKVRAPSLYPHNSIIDVGELPFDQGIDLSAGEMPARFLKYDAENRDYYKALYEKLAAYAQTDHQIIDSICKYVATRLNPREDPWGFKSARQIIERGAPHCSNFAFAMAAITSAGGYPSRTVHTSDTPDYAHTHVAVEVFYADGWHLYDPTFGVFFLNNVGAIASYRELRLNPALMTLEAFQQIKPKIARSALAWMPSAYSSGLHQVYEADESAFADACSILDGQFQQ